MGLLSVLVQDATSDKSDVIRKAAAGVIFAMDDTPLDTTKVLGLVAAIHRYTARFIWPDDDARGFWALCALDYMTRYTKGVWVNMLSHFPTAALSTSMDLALWMNGAKDVYTPIAQTILSQSHWTPIAYFLRKTGLLPKPPQTHNVSSRIVLSTIAKYFSSTPTIPCCASFATHVISLATTRAEDASRMWLYKDIVLQDGEAPECQGCGTRLDVVVEEHTKPLCVGQCTRGLFGDLLCASCAGVDVNGMRHLVSEEVILKILS